MTQDDLKDYVLLPDHDCYIYKELKKPEGIFYYIRRAGTTQLAVLFPPKSGIYKEENVCHVCKQLKITVPNWAKSAEQTLDDAEKNSMEDYDPPSK
jgi:hypothetical protein